MLLKLYLLQKYFFFTNQQHYIYFTIVPPCWILFRTHNSKILFRE